jgi:hypothetical protein
MAFWALNGFTVNVFLHVIVIISIGTRLKYK